MQNIVLPHNFNVRWYQLPLLKAFDQGIKRAILVMHRRAGKDLLCWNLLIREALKTVGSYGYIFPNREHARRVIWESFLGDGLRYLDCIPKNLAKFNNKELKITFKNGSIIRMLAANADSLVGMGLRGVIFSEYQIISPAVYAFLEPMVKEKDGFIIVNGTPRGENHFKRTYDMAVNNDDWYSCYMPNDKTKVFSEKDIEDIRTQGIMTEEMIQQEYFCSWKGIVEGTYYGDTMIWLEENGRITNVDYDRNVPVHTAWDLGKNDLNCIWFFQIKGNQIHVIDYHADKNKDFPDYAKILYEKNYMYGTHFAPHDIRQNHLGMSKSKYGMAYEAGIRFNILPKLPVDHGIMRVREILRFCYFDREKTKEGIDALKAYHRKYDDIKQHYSDAPEHDWASNGADAFRYLAIGYDDHLTFNNQEQKNISNNIVIPQKKNDLIVTHPIYGKNRFPANYLKRGQSWFV